MPSSILGIWGFNCTANNFISSPHVWCKKQFREMGDGHKIQIWTWKLQVFISKFHPLLSVLPAQYIASLWLIWQHAVFATKISRVTFGSVNSTTVLAVLVMLSDCDSKTAKDLMDAITLFWCGICRDAWGDWLETGFLFLEQNKHWGGFKDQVTKCLVCLFHCPP